MARKIKFWIESIPSDHDDIEEFDDSASEAEIEEAARDFAMNFVSWGWTEISQEADTKIAADPTQGTGGK